MLRRLLSFFLLIAACDCSDDPGAPCTSDAECGAGTCIDGRCVAPDTDGGAGDATGDGGACEATETSCGFGASQVCCSPGQVCFQNMCADDCGADVRCGDQCCGAGFLCDVDRCIADCSDETKRCGAADELCCGDEQVCLSRSCVDLGAMCEFSEQCDADEICLPSEMRCVPRDLVEVCTVDPPPAGEFTPRRACSWTPPEGPFSALDRAIVAPSVGNLTDDNGDGVTDRRDIPDIVFPSATTGTSIEAVIRIVHGQCNDDETMRTIATIGPDNYDVSSAILIANLHPDSMDDERAPEIVASQAAGALVAFRRTSDDGSTWEEMWRTPALTNGRATRGVQPAAADLNGDGQPEVFVANVVYDGLTGTMLWDGDATLGGTPGTGRNGPFGPVSIASDLDLNGSMEIIAGGTVYDGMTGDEVWSYTFPIDPGVACGGRCDGFPAVGNFDDDDEAEVVVIRAGDAYFFDHTGTLLETIAVPIDDCFDDMGRERNESGPPTVADFDGDGRPEVGTAGADFYVVMDLDCLATPLPDGCESRGILWTAANFDCSSRSTGSSVFDFEGDGRAEVIYADEQNFRIFDGVTGRILFDDDSYRSNTRIEMPIVVDVDNDGKSEIVVPEPRSGNGIEVWEDTNNNWVRTRRIWNQHSYHVTNITEDGQVPRNETPNWTEDRLNNFRQNVQPDGLFDAPDLVVTSVDTAACAAAAATTIQVTVSNQGAVGVGSGMPVAVYATPMDGTEEFVGVVRTTRLLLPGQSETVSIEWAPDPPVRVLSARAVVDSDGAGGMEYRECDEDNNEGVGMDLMGCVGPV